MVGRLSDREISENDQMIAFPSTFCHHRDRTKPKLRILCPSGSLLLSQQKQSMCITLIQRFDVGPTLYKCCTIRGQRSEIIENQYFPVIF